MAVLVKGFYYEGLSSDTKPTTNVPTNARFLETNTGKEFSWNGSSWSQITGQVPPGLIAMWSGTIANIPAGWVICDGNNGTPNLLAKFVEGVATAATNPGTTGGAVSKTTGAPSATVGATHTTTEETPGSATHTHTISDIRPPYYDVAFIMKT